MNRKYRDDCPKALIKFFDYQSTIKNKSDLTIDEYCLDLKNFFKFLVAKRNNIIIDNNDDLNNVNIKDLTNDFYESVLLEDAYAFLAYCKTDRDNKERARARKVSSIRSFFKYLQMNGIIETNPMLNLDSPKLSKNLPKYLTVEQAKQLLSVISGKNRERDYCIITLFLNCGMRLSELVSINYNAIRYTDDYATVTIRGKGNKERTVYLNKACISALNCYMAVRPKDGVKDKNALFLSNRLTRISPKTVQHLVDEYLEKAGLGGQGFSVHKLRHTAATLMYQSGNVDVLQLKEILGHENLNTTQIYTHLLDNELLNAVNSNPLADIDAPDSNTNQSE